MQTSTLLEKERSLIHAYWRAANYLSVGQIYLLDNPLLNRIYSQEDLCEKFIY